MLLVYKRVLVCGDREWRDAQMIRDALYEEPPDVLIEGEARGADRIARAIAEHELGIEVMRFPADWTRFKKGAGPIRNQQMLDEGKPDVVWVFHDALWTRSKGTRDMVERAQWAGIPAWLFQHGAAPTRL